jgi:hypothetical protein
VTNFTSSLGLDVHTQNCIPAENQRSDFCSGPVWRHHTETDSAVGEEAEIQSKPDSPVLPATSSPPLFLPEGSMVCPNSHGR